MVGLGCAVGVGVRVQPNCWRYHHHLAAITFPSSSSSSSSSKNYANFTTTNGRFRSVTPHNNSQNREGGVEEEGVSSSSSEWIRNSGIISSCLVGLLTGVAVVLFNNVVSSFLLFIYLLFIHFPFKYYDDCICDQYQCQYAGS